MWGSLMKGMAMSQRGHTSWEMGPHCSLNLVSPAPFVDLYLHVLACAPYFMNVCVLYLTL